jgi:hypothetical protein
MNTFHEKYLVFNYKNQKLIQLNLYNLILF